MCLLNIIFVRELRMSSYWFYACTTCLTNLCVGSNATKNSEAWFVGVGQREAWSLTTRKQEREQVVVSAPPRRSDMFRLDVT